MESVQENVPVYQPEQPKKIKWLAFFILIFCGILLILSLGFFYWNKYYRQSKEQVEVGSQETILGELLPIEETRDSPLPTSLSTPTPIPESKILIGGTHSFQTFNNCGPASLSMALSYYGIAESQQTLGNELRPYQVANGDNDDKSVTLQELAKKGEEFDFLVYHRPAGDMDMVTQFIALDIPVITRTWLEPTEDIGHYRVIKGYDKTRNIIVQDDSLQGKDLEYSYEDFNQLWQAFNYEFLVLVPQDKQQLAETILGERVTENAAWNLALAQASNQLEQDPTNVYAQFNQSVALYELEKYQEAVVAYEQIENLLPSRMLWYQIEPILAYYQLGNFEKVFEMSNAILTNQNRAFSELYAIQAQMYQQQGQLELADEAQQKARLYNGSTYWQENIPAEVVF